MIRFRTLAVVCLGLAVEIGTVPSAVAGPSEDAATLKSEADAALNGRRFAEALDKYRAALDKNRDARLHYNIAQALAALERHPEALAAYQSFIAEAPAGTLNEAQQAQLFSLVEELKRKIARVEVHCGVPGVRILVRGKAVGITPLASAVVLNAGEAKLEATNRSRAHSPWKAARPGRCTYLCSESTSPGPLASRATSPAPMCGSTAYRVEGPRWR